MDSLAAICIIDTAHAVAWAPQTHCSTCTSRHLVSALASLSSSRGASKQSCSTPTPLGGWDTDPRVAQKMCVSNPCQVAAEVQPFPFTVDRAPLEYHPRFPSSPRTPDVCSGMVIARVNYTAGARVWCSSGPIRCTECAFQSQAMLPRKASRFPLPHKAPLHTLPIHDTESTCCTENVRFNLKPSYRGSPGISLLAIHS
jgi:hypothetical protein